MPGHGDSPLLGGASMPQIARRIAQFCAVRGHDLIMLVGHSMGGTISFLYAGTFPERVRKLVLVEGIGPIAMQFVDSPPRMERWLAEVKALSHRKIVEYPTLEKAAERLRRKNPRLKPELALELARSAMKLTEGGKWVWKFDPLHRTAAPHTFYSRQAVEFFRRIECPVLLVNGKESRQTARADQEERINAISDLTQAEVEAAGHMIHHDNPERLAEVVAKFLDR